MRVLILGVDQEFGMRLTYGECHNTLFYCRNIRKLERRLEFFLAEQPVELFKVSESGPTDFQVESSFETEHPR